MALQYLRVVDNVVCFRCNFVVETGLHVMKDCVVSSQLFQLMGILCFQPVEVEMVYMEWLIQVWDPISISDQQVAVMCMRLLWNARKNT